MKKFVFILIVTLVFFNSCNSNFTSCENPQQGKAVLVAYRVAKHSHLWLNNPDDGKIYNIGGLGGRRQPTINLGDTILVSYCNSEVSFDRHAYVERPVNGKTRFICLYGYEYIYP